MARIELLAETQTDTNGKYELRLSVSAGDAIEIWMDAQAPGFWPYTLPMYLQRRIPAFPKKVQAGDTLKVDLALVKAVHLTGIVVGETNQPIGGAVISATLCGTEGCYLLGRTYSDEQGEFELFEVPQMEQQPGQLFLNCEHAAYASTRTRVSRYGALPGRIDTAIRLGRPEPATP